MAAALHAKTSGSTGPQPSETLEVSLKIHCRSVVDLDTGKRSLKWSFGDERACQKQLRSVEHGPNHQTGQHSSPPHLVHSTEPLQEFSESAASRKVRTVTITTPTGDGERGGQQRACPDSHCLGPPRNEESRTASPDSHRLRSLRNEESYLRLAAIMTTATTTTTTTTTATTTYITDEPQSGDESGKERSKGCCNESCNESCKEACSKTFIFQTHAAAVLESGAISATHGDVCLEVGTPVFHLPARSGSQLSSGPSTSTPSLKALASFLFKAEDPPTVLPEFATFEGSKELLRASPLHAVIKQQGSLFRNSAGSSDTFGLSREVPAIHTFISHNWSTPRGRKFLGIAHHFNFKLAQIGALLAWGTIGLLSVTGHAPTIPNQSLQQSTGWLGRVFVAPLFMLILLFQRDFTGLLGLNGPDVFLDKTCIHQVDSTLKQRGIEKLPAFLRKSQYMLALYVDSMYLERMWTVYEVAAFLAFRPSRNMIVCELNQLTLLYSILFLIWANTLLDMGIDVVVPIPRALQIGILSVLTVGLLVLLRYGAVNRSLILERLRKFDVNMCKCTLEQDRSILCQNIALLMRTRADLPRASDAEALTYFNQLVQTELPQVFRTALHPLAISYQHVVTFTLLISGTARVDRILATSDPDETLASSLGQVAGLLFWWFLAMPLCYACLQFVANSFLKWRGWRAWTRLSILIVLLGEPFIGLNFLVLAAAESADAGEPWAWAALAGLFVLGGLAVRLMFSQWFWSLKLRCA